MNDVENVEFDYKQNIFSVSFASDNYNLPEKTQYMYKLEGFNNDWLTLPLGVHNVTFTNLAPGKYVLRVKAINSDGYVGIKEATLGIVVNPPFGCHGGLICCMPSVWLSCSFWRVTGC